MNSNDYVLNHDFGYGRVPEVLKLNKLELRNVEDLKFYVNWSIRELFSAVVDDKNIINFVEDGSKVQIIIEEFIGDWL
ncbi:MAG: hypothetical protein IJA61_02140 [Clostridia bacterium]|nr:hypothetical protein [Clostridia bacterium]